MSTHSPTWWDWIFITLNNVLFETIAISNLRMTLTIQWRNSFLIKAQDDFISYFLKQRLRKPIALRFSGMWTDEHRSANPWKTGLGSGYFCLYVLTDKTQLIITARYTPHRLLISEIKSCPFCAWYFVGCMSRCCLEIAIRHHARWLGHPSAFWARGMSLKLFASLTCRTWTRTDHYNWPSWYRIRLIISWVAIVSQSWQQLSIF
jgi:hypothetical protein